MISRDPLHRLDLPTAAIADTAIDHDVIHQCATIPLILSIVAA